MGGGGGEWGRGEWRVGGGVGVGSGCSKLDNTTVVKKTPGKSWVALLISNKTGGL